MVFLRKLVFLTLALALSVAACDSRDTSTHTGKRRTAVPVEIVPVEHATLSAQYIISGTLEAVRRVQLFNEEVGTIIELPFAEGDLVKKSDKLVRLDDALIRAQLDKATATRKQTQVDLNRLTKLIKRNLASQDEVAQARTALDLARAEEQLLQTRLNRTIINAPFDGVISQRLREPGDVVPLHSHILSIIDPNTLRARIAISELLLHELDVGSAVTVRIDALGDQQFPAKVSRIHPTVDPATRKGTVDVELDPVPDGALPGQLCRISIASRTAKRTTVPFAAVRQDAHGEFVFAIDGEQVRLTRITTGHRFGDRIEVIEGLKTGSQVVVKGFLGLSDGREVEVVNPEGPARQAGANRT